MEQEWMVKKIEPWNSIRVTFTIPREAAARLHQLAEVGDSALRQLGILSVHVEGDQTISVKVAGPNHEATELSFRTDGAGPSSESIGHSSIVRSVTQAVCGANVAAPPFSQQHPQPHPMPQFRSPTVMGAGGTSVPTARPTVVQPRSQGQGYTYPGINPMHPRHIQQTPTNLLVSGVSQTRPSPVLPQQVFRTNPPPPYPSQDGIIRQPVNALQQSGVTQVSGQFVGSHTSVVNTLPVPVTPHPQQVTTIAQPVSGGYRISGSQVNVTNSVVVQPSRGTTKTNMNMVKSPLLVGLLQQPEQSSQVFVPRCPKGISVQNSHSVSNPVTTVTENTAIPPVTTNISSSISPIVSTGGTFVGKSRDGLTTHQIFSGGSVITSAVPSVRHNPISGHSQQSIAHPTLPNVRLQQSVIDPRKVVVNPSSSLPESSVPITSQPTVLPQNSILTPTAVSRSLTAEENDTSDSFSQMSHKKESQLLINPNTGLLEPRPNTDSSDSDGEDRSSPLQDDQNSVSIPSDSESAASHKETDHSDSDVSRISSNSFDSRKATAQERAKSRETDTSPNSSRENSIVNSSPAETIKVRLKLGNEQVAQTTIVGSAPKKVERNGACSMATGFAIQNPEPRVPKLHIKLHSNQPVIVKPVEDVEILNRKLDNTVREDKIKKKTNRSKPKSESEFDSILKGRGNKTKICRDRNNSSEDINNQVLKAFDSKRNFDDSPRSVKFKDSDRLKLARLLEENRVSLMKSSGKVDSKPRTKLKSNPHRKIGDLSSVGEIASHKILETLPPSITKVAAMHTQQPHRNPSPSPSASSPLFTSSSSLTAVVSTSSPSTSMLIPSSTGDSNLITKTDSEVSSASDSLMTKGRIISGNPPPYQSLMNGDLSHTEKMGLKMRTKPGGPVTSDISGGKKLTIKLKAPEEYRSIDALKKELPEGLGTVPTFLNSSVLINKVSSEKSCSSSGHLTSHCHGDDITEKFKKVDGIKMPLVGLKSNSDITIHSVSKSDVVIGLNKINESEQQQQRRLDTTIKHKPEVTKVGRVTCVDVTDRQALEEALKSSRNSSKKADDNKNTSSNMVDRLRRWNSIDGSNSLVPFSSHSQQTISESTNFYTTGEVKPEPGGDIETKRSVPTISDNVKNKSCVSHHPQLLDTLGSVDNKDDCDNRGNLHTNDQEDTNSTLKQSDLPNNNERVPSPDKVTKSDLPLSNSQRRSAVSLSSGNSDIVSPSNSHLLLMSQKGVELKVQDSVTPSLLKTEVESPEGTPKGEHGNGQGGEDSGIESMDALSEKSPNLSDQSPNRRDEKDSDVYHCKERKDEKSEESIRVEGNSSDVNTKGCQIQVNTPVNYKEEIGLPKTFEEMTDNHTDSPCMSNSEKCVTNSKESPISSSTVVSEINCDNTSGSEKSNCTENSLSTENISKGEVSPPSQGSQFQSRNNPVTSLPSHITPSELTGCHTSRNEVAEINKDHSSEESCSSVQDSVQNIEKQLANFECAVPACDLPVSVTTTSITTSSAKVNTTVTSQSAVTHSFTSSPSANCTLQSSHSVSSTLVNCAAPVTKTVIPISSSYKPSLLAITLSRPPGSGMTSQYAASIANNIDNSKSVISTSEVSLPIASVEKRVLNNIDNQTNVYCQSIPCNNNSIAYSNSYTSGSVNTTTTMIILAASNGNSTTSTSALSNKNKVTLKQNPVQAVPAAINPPVGKAFRLVALPGVNSVAPASSPVKGQLVTLKPVVNTSVNSSVTMKSLQSQTTSNLTSVALSPKAVDLPKEQIAAETFSPTHTNVPEDLDFVGFSSDLTMEDRTAHPIKEEVYEDENIVTNANNKCLSKAENEPTPLRVHPPLYTYSNRERKKADEGDIDEKDKEEIKEQLIPDPIATLNDPFVEKPEKMKPDGDEIGIKLEEESNIKPKMKEKNLDALTIEIPAVDNFPDDKRLTRSTRQSARLASPKVNSPGCELSPRVERRSPALNKPSPVSGIMKASVSPALRIGKRRRHESDSSNASSACGEEALLDPPSKITRRNKTSLVNANKDESVKGRSTKGRESDADSKVLESSDDDTMHLEDELKKILTTTEEEDEVRPSSRLCRPTLKTTTRTRDRPNSAESPSSKESTGAPRRTARQTKTLLTGSSSTGTTDDPSEKESENLTDTKDNIEEDSNKSDRKKGQTKEVLKDCGMKSSPDPKKVPSGGVSGGKDACSKVLQKDLTKTSSAPSSQKGKRENESDADNSTGVASSRRKTRSTTNNANEDSSKRRRLSKDK